MQKIIIPAESKKTINGKVTTHLDQEIWEARKRQSLSVFFPQENQLIRLNYQGLQNDIERYSTIFLGITIWVDYNVQFNFRLIQSEVSPITKVQRSESGWPINLREKVIRKK